MLNKPWKFQSVNENYNSVFFIRKIIGHWSSTNWKLAGYAYMYQRITGIHHGLIVHTNDVSVMRRE